MSQELLLASSLILIAAVFRAIAAGVNFISTALGAAFDWLKNRDTERERTKRHELALGRVQPGPFSPRGQEMRKSQ